MLLPRLLVGEVLEVVGDDQRGRAALAHGDAHRPVDEVAHLRGGRGLLHEGAGHVLEQADEVELLLVVRSPDVARLLAGDGQHRHVVEAGVVQPRDQVRGARPRGGETHPDLAGELGVGRRHERRHLLVADLDELEGQVEALHGAQQAVDAVAGVAEDRPDAPLRQTLPEEVPDRLGHLASPARDGGGRAEPDRGCPGPSRRQPERRIRVPGRSSRPAARRSLASHAIAPRAAARPVAKAAWRR